MFHDLGLILQEDWLSGLSSGAADLRGKWNGGVRRQGSAEFQPGFLCGLIFGRLAFAGTGAQTQERVWHGKSRVHFDEARAPCGAATPEDSVAGAGALERSRKAWDDSSEASRAFMLPWLSR